MANYVTISTIGFRSPTASSGADPERLVEEMLAFLRRELDQVLPDRPDLVVLPEECDRYDGLPAQESAAYYRARGDRIQSFLRGIAKEHRCYIAYPTLREIASDGSRRNSVIILDRAGEVAGIYNKNHVVMSEYEDGGVLYGKDAPLIACDFGRVACVICFDLNFDALRLRYARQRPDLVVFSSMYHGGLMQGHWAYSCRSHFVAAVSRLPSAILSPLGEVIAQTTNYFDFVTARVNLDCAVAHLDGHYEKLAALKRKYGPGVKVHDPGLLGSVLITSEMADRTAKEMMQEFEIITLDEYFAKSLAHRDAPGHTEA